MNQDAVVKRLLKRLLLRDKRLSSQHIELVVEDSCVSLQGYVHSLEAKEAAAEIASNLPGVFAVVNKLAVRLPSKLPDAIIAENVRVALEMHPRIVKDAITVTVREADVTLSGSVSHDEERLIALDTALGATGVRHVENSLQIDPVRRSEDSTKAQDLKKAILEALRDPRSRVRVAINEGTGVLSGWVATEALKQSAEAVAGQFSLMTLRNEIQVEHKSTSPAAPDSSPNTSFPRMES